MVTLALRSLDRLLVGIYDITDKSFDMMFSSAWRPRKIAARLREKKSGASLVPFGIPP